jgi:fructose-1-phosphate kinase PfkB-like protein
MERIGEIEFDSLKAKL